jgi:hypothetical protein
MSKAPAPAGATTPEPLFALAYGRCGGSSTCGSTRPKPDRCNQRLETACAATGAGVGSVWACGPHSANASRRGARCGPRPHARSILFYMPEFHFNLAGEAGGVSLRGVPSGVAGNLAGRAPRPVRSDINPPGAARRTAEPALHFRERCRRAVAGKHRGDRQDGIVMASLARGDQFAGVGRQIGKGRRCAHGLPVHRAISRRNQGRRASSRAARKLSISCRCFSASACRS